MQKRAGLTAKISISLDREDLKALKKRAKRLFGGNVSAVIAELADDAKLLEGISDLVDALGGPVLTDDDRRRIDREWQNRTATPTTKRKPKQKKAA
jgi:hypothetical protein